jgi:hypothetical protein
MMGEVLADVKAGFRACATDPVTDQPGLAAWKGANHNWQGFTEGEHDGLVLASDSVSGFDDEADGLITGWSNLDDDEKEATRISYLRLREMVSRLAESV